MKLYIMTDLEGVVGVMNFEDRCRLGSRYYEWVPEAQSVRCKA